MDILAWKRPISRDIMKILAIIVAYNPSIDELTRNVSSFIDSVDRLIVWDNSPVSSLKSLLLNDKIDVFSDGHNRGIAYALNRAVKIFNSPHEDYTHLLTMDQDSTWFNFLDYVDEIGNFCDESIIFSPNINKEVTVSNSKLEVNYCITSGALFSKYVLNRIGPFNEEYSIDCVDYDFSFKVRNIGGKIVKISRAELLQNYGIEKTNKFFGFKVNEYSARRLYFIVRNHILLFRDYPQNRYFPLYFNSFKNYLFFKIPKILFMENNKLSKVFYLLLGFYHGLIDNRTRSY